MLRMLSWEYMCVCLDGALVVARRIVHMNAYSYDLSYINASIGHSIMPKRLKLRFWASTTVASTFKNPRKPHPLYIADQSDNLMSKCVKRYTHMYFHIEYGCLLVDMHVWTRISCVWRSACAQSSHRAWCFMLAAAAGPQMVVTSMTGSVGAQCEQVG